MVSGGLRKVGPEIRVSFSTPAKKKKRVYEDKFPKKLSTLEQVKKKHGVVVWCNFIACKYNLAVEGLQRTSGTLLKNRTYQPIAEQEHIWSRICDRDEIAIQFTEVLTSTRAKVKVPSCFVASTSPAGHIDFSRFLNSDGSPLGGNIDSQHVSDDGFGALDSNSIY